MVDSRDFETAQRGILAVLHQKAFDLSRLPAASKELETVMNTIVKLTTLEHKRQQLALQREKLARSSTIIGGASVLASRPVHHHVDLNIVPLNRTNLDQSENISAAHPPAQLSAPPENSELCTLNSELKKPVMQIYAHNASPRSSDLESKSPAEPKAPPHNAIDPNSKA